MFDTILEKLGFKSSSSKSSPPASPVSAATASQPSAPQAPAKPASSAAAQAPAQTSPPPSAAPPPAAPTAKETVDVTGKLEQLAAKNPQQLNWRTSIVDLLKLLDIDSSFLARKELAAELSCPAEKMGDSAQMNMWLHKAVLRKLAENGGNVPDDLLH